VIRRKWAVTLLVVLLTVTACSQDDSAEDFSATQLDSPFAISGSGLTSTDGREFEFPADLDNRLNIVFFGYTHCPDICPAILGSLAAGLVRLDADERSQVTVYFVSTDPKRDTLPAIDRYLAHCDDKFIGLRGDIGSVVDLGKSVGVFVDQGDQLPTGGYDPNAHGTYLIGVEKSGSAPVVWDANTAPFQFAGDIRFMLNH
jgi:protein SCO1/2